ncbi:hypothetical protein [uncultured Shimia sp.]|uniref:hypothetical protein n=1 Tax=uncultured Shimia sp. TaxID=573152 RepID=UPI0026090FE9|nr:hypothetical protein [uncultured Shimia sp.]
MTRMLRTLNPTTWFRVPSLEHFVASLDRENYLNGRLTAAERPFRSAPDRPALYPFAPL